MLSQETLTFLSDLAADNTRDWFTANKARYETAMKAPAKAFTDALAAELQRSTGGPVDARIFRIHRDVRFSRDKTPYNSHLHIMFTGGGRRDMGWMVAVEPGKLTLGYGLFQFTPAQLDAWRKAVDGPAGAAIATIVAVPGLRLDDPALKRVPSPYGKDHPRGDLLRRKGMALWRDDLPVEAALGDGAPAALAEALAVFDPLRGWLSEHLPASK